MIGNLWEWTEEWEAGLRTSETQPIATWPDPAYNKDSTWSIESGAGMGNPYGWLNGFPAAGARGGHWAYADQAGVFALALGSGPSDFAESLGFRCVVSR